MDTCSPDPSSPVVKNLSLDDLLKLEQQNSRLVPEFKARKLEEEAGKHWDLFYKRNGDRFFKDRHWTTREFRELLNGNTKEERSHKKRLLEIGCGVGNFIFPLLEEKLNFEILGCDISTRAVDLVKAHPLYKNEHLSEVFVTDITTDHILSIIDEGTIDIVTMIFVLSSIIPEKHALVLGHIWKLLRPGGIVLFRDYGLHDMAQLRFKPGHKISENFYMRQDGTRSYYFSLEAWNKVAVDSGFELVDSYYVHRRTINKKENIDVPRIFIQSKLRKAAS